ncbi:MAG TPA: Na+/H+ antiporter subunit E [Xanthomonadales bacterium]|nr:Na+/H+ antiporter subunit E [Xanthomonadales bacterium]
MHRRIIAAILLFALTWLLWSGFYTPLLLMLGAASCALVTFLAIRTGFFDRELYTLHLGPRLPAYWWWLIREIIKANFTVARIVLHPRLPIQPRIIRIDASGLPNASQATLANSITLTPGSLTLDIDNNRIEVHCLTAESAADLEQGEMLRRARKLASN